MDPNRLVLLVGAPRSGTTWLQTILSNHPSVVSPQETDLFSRFIEPLAQAWDWQIRGTTDDWKQRRFKGLPAVFTEAEYTTAVAQFVTTVTDKVLGMKPSATIMLEKSPAHSLTTDTVIRFAPATTFVHLVRDGRDVVTSLNAAGRGWGAHWAPTDVASAASMWASHVRGARHAIDAPGGYAEVRYEVLRSAGSPEIIRVFDAIGIDLSNEAAEALLAREAVTTTRPSDNAVGARTITTSPNRNAEIRVGGMFAEFSDGQEPDGFAGKATSGSWKQWTPSERYEFDEAAGDLLVELGYEPDRSWAACSPARRTAIQARSITARGLRAGASRAARLASRIAPSASVKK